MATAAPLRSYLRGSHLRRQGWQCSSTSTAKSRRTDTSELILDQTEDGKTYQTNHETQRHVDNIKAQTSNYEIYEMEVSI